MIRRDYILRMIEEFFEAISRINALKKGQHWQEAAGELDGEFQRLIGAGAPAVARLTETELLSRIIQGEPTHVVHQKTLMLTTLLKQAGDVAVGQDRPEEGRSCYLKGLHLLLESLARTEVSEWPEFVPKVEVFVAALRGAPLPLETEAMLMQHYELAGDFAKAEDRLFAMLDGEPGNLRLLEFGLAFYRRLEAHSDATLAEGGLPRAEVEAGATELRGRQAALAV
jgi:hypothetical protein